MYNVTVYFPHSILLPSLCPPPLSLLGVTVFVFVSQWKPLTGLILEGNLLLYFCFSFCFFFCFFCKAYDSYCIRASSNNKNSKKLLLRFVFNNLLMEIKLQDEERYTFIALEKNKSNDCILFPALLSVDNAFNGHKLGKKC